MGKDIRILLVDDQEVVRRGVRAMLEQERDMEIVGDCASAEEAMAQAERLSPDIVLIDIRMPGMNGIEACRRLKGNGLPCNVIMLTLYEEHLVDALKAGAAAYLPKDIKRGELLQTIRQVYGNEPLIDERDGSAKIEDIDLVILPPADAGQVLGFLDQVQQTLGASILQTVGSWDRGTTIAMALECPTSLTHILDKLEEMPDVEKADEKRRAGDGFPNFLRQVGNSKTSTRKRILVALKQATGVSDQ